MLKEFLRFCGATVAVAAVGFAFCALAPVAKAGEQENTIAYAAGLTMVVGKCTNIQLTEAALNIRMFYYAIPETDEAATAEWIRGMGNIDDAIERASTQIGRERACLALTGTFPQIFAMRE